MKKKLFTLLFLLTAFIGGMNAQVWVCPTDKTTGYDSGEKGYAFTNDAGFLYKAATGGQITILAASDGSACYKTSSSQFFVKVNIAISGIKVKVNPVGNSRYLKEYAISTVSLADVAVATTTSSSDQTPMTKNEIGEYTYTISAAAGSYIRMLFNGNLDQLIGVTLIPAQTGPSTDATIKSLTVDEEALTALENVYSKELPNSYANATVPVVITPNSDKAVVTVSSDATANTTAGAYTTNVAVPSEVTITVTPEDTETPATTYILKVTKAATQSADNSLASVTLDGEALVADADGNYAKEVPFAYAGAFLVEATATDDAATVSYENNSPAIDGGASATVTIKVKAENGDEKPYTVTINRVAASTACELTSFSINGFVGTIEGQNVTVKTIEGYDFSHTPVMSVSSLANKAWDAVNKTVTVTAESGAANVYNVAAAAEFIQPYKVEAETELSFAAATYTDPVEWIYGTSWSETMKGVTADDKETAIGGYEIKQTSGSNDDGKAKGEAYQAAGSNYIRIYVANCKTLTLKLGATGGRTINATIGDSPCGSLVIGQSNKSTVCDLACEVNSEEPVVVSVTAPGSTGGTRVFSMSMTPYQGGNSIDSEIAENGMAIYAIDGMVHVSVSKARLANVYSIDGRLVKVAELVEGDNTISGLAKGMYLVDNQKIIVK